MVEPSHISAVVLQQIRLHPVEVCVRAGRQDLVLGSEGSVVRQIGAQPDFRLLDLVPPENALNDLLRAQSNQHADNDDPYFTGELAPSMQRLWQVEMHCSRPPSGGGRLTEGLMSAMGRTQTAGLGGKQTLRISISMR